MIELEHTWRDLILERFYEEETQSKISDIEDILIGDDKPKIDQIVFSSSENSDEKFILKARGKTNILPHEMYKQVLVDLFSMQAEINKEIPTAISDLLAESSHDNHNQGDM